MNDTRVEKLSTVFIVTLSVLVFFGIVMVFSSSYMYSKEHFGNSYHFLLKQIINIFLGVGLAFLISRTKFNFWYKHCYKIHGILLGILSLTLIPGLGVMIKGSRRWLSLGVMNLQPGEFVKYTIILVAIKFFDNFNDYSARERLGYSLLLLYPLSIFTLQPDFGTFFISFTIMAFVAFLSTFPRRYFYSGIALGMVGVVMVLFAAPYRVKRVMVFLNPWKDPRNGGFQIIQSFLAFAHGSVFGQGLGNSSEKLFYLPEAYNDFIFSVVGEELGFVGVCFCVMTFLFLIFNGFRLSLYSRDRLKTLVMSTVIFSIGLQVFLNMGVVLGVLPTKGLNLPFISYGGSSIVSNLCAIGFFFCALNSTSASKERTASNIKLKNVFG